MAESKSWLDSEAAQPGALRLAPAEAVSPTTPQAKPTWNDVFADVFKAVGQGLRGVAAGVAESNKLLLRIAKTLDLQLTVGGARMPFGGGVGTFERVQLASDTSIRAVFTNLMNRPVRVRVVVVSVGEATVRVQDRSDAKHGLTLDLTVLGDDTGEVVVMPGGRLFISPSADPGGGALLIETIDWSAWLESGKGKKPGSELHAD